MPHGLEAAAGAPYVVRVPAVDERLVSVNPAIWRRLAALLEVELARFGENVPRNGESHAPTMAGGQVELSGGSARRQPFGSNGRMDVSTERVRKWHVFFFIFQNF